MAEFVPIDTSEDLDLVNRVLSEGVDDRMTGLNQAEKPVQEDSPVTNSQEYVHRFKDGTVSTYALSEFKKCPVAGGMSEDQLKKLLKFSSMGMHELMEKNSLSKSAEPDREKVQPKSIRFGLVRPVEADRPVLRPPIDYQQAVTEVVEETVRPINSPVMIKQDKKRSPGLVPESASRTIHRANKIEPVTITEAFMREPVAERELPGSTLTETITDFLPVDPEDLELSRETLSVTEDVCLPDVQDSVGSTEIQTGSIELDEPDITELDVVRLDDEETIPAVETIDEDPEDEQILPTLDLEELRGIDEYLDELIAMSIGENQTIDTVLADPPLADLRQELYYDAVAELSLWLSRELEEKDLSDCVHRGVDKPIEEVDPHLDESIEDEVDLTDHGTHEAKLGIVQKWLAVRTLAGHLEHVLGSLGVYCACL